MKVGKLKVKAGENKHIRMGVRGGVEPHSKNWLCVAFWVDWFLFFSCQ